MNFYETMVPEFNLIDQFYKKRALKIYQFYSNTIGINLQNQDKQSKT